MPVKLCWFYAGSALNIQNNISLLVAAPNQFARLYYDAENIFMLYIITDDFDNMERILRPHLNAKIHIKHVKIVSALT